MQLIRKHNKGITYLLCVIDLFSKYAWIVPLKDKKGITIVNAFHSILDKSKRKPNKIWVDQGSDFYNKVFMKFLKDSDISIYSTYNEGKSLVAERFIRTLKNKISKHITSISKNVYYDVLDDIVDEYNNTYHKTIKMKPIDVTSDFIAEYNEESNEKDPKFKVGNLYGFPKDYTPKWSKEIFIAKKENTVPWTYIITDSNGEEIEGSFYEKELQKTNRKKCKIEKVIKRKGNKLYMKWK